MYKITSLIAFERAHYYVQLNKQKIALNGIQIERKTENCSKCKPTHTHRDDKEKEEEGEGNK